MVIKNIMNVELFSLYLREMGQNISAFTLPCFVYSDSQSDLRPVTGRVSDLAKQIVMDEETKETLRIIRAQLDLGQDIEEEVNWADVRPVGVDIFDKVYVYTTSFKDRIYNKFKKSKEIIQEILPENRTGDELTRELEDAWNLYSRVGQIHTDTFLTLFYREQM